jgi:hypothetical protein
VLHRLQNTLIVETGRLCDQIELIGDGKFNVAISVAEQFGEFGLDRIEHDNFRGDDTKQRGCFFRRLGRRAADDLRHPGQFLHAMTLHDPFRAECDLEAASLTPEIRIDPIGGAGIKRRTQHQ